MPSTAPLTVKLEKNQIDSLRSLPDPITSGVVIRVLLRLFLSGKLPAEVHDLILEEARAAKLAFVNGGYYAQKALAMKRQQKKGA